MDKLLKLYCAFFRIGLFTFGGGYSMLPMLEREVVERNRWSTREELLDYFAIGQCTPGIIAINTATLVGCKERGFLGALFATAGMLTPSIVIITIIAAGFSSLSDLPMVNHAFAGIRAAVAALIASAVIKLFKSNILENPKNKSAKIMSACLGAFAFIFVVFFRLSPVYIVIAATIIGIVLYGRRGSA